MDIPIIAGDGRYRIDVGNVRNISTRICPGAHPDSLT
jgi:hypothetical protein